MTVATKLSERALLVSLNVRMWSGRILDKQIQDDIAANSGTAKKAVNPHKNLYPSLDATIDGTKVRANLGSYTTEYEKLLKMFKEIGAKHGSVRTHYYESCLPWVKGSWIMPSAIYLNFCAKHNQLKSEAEAAVYALAPYYSRLCDLGALALNGIGRKADYPTWREFQKKYSVKIQFFPLSDASDFRVKMADDAIDALKAQAEEAIKQTLAISMRAPWQRLHDAIRKISVTLKDSKAIFRDTLFSNLADLCQLLPAFNLADDPDLTRMALEAESLLATSPEDARKDATIRSSVAAEADRILSNMSGFFVPQTDTDEEDQ